MAARWGFWGGLAAFALMLILPAPAGMPAAAWHTTAIIVLMAVWWMTEALPLTATALVPFLAFPLFGIMTATDSAAAYYSPILFLVLGGAIIALAIELDEGASSRTERDKFVYLALTAAGLPLLRVRVQEKYETAALRKDIEDALGILRKKKRA